MTSKGISDRIKSFLAEHIDSVGTLETLLLLYSEPEREWSALEISDTLKTNESQTRSQLESLEKTGLSEGRPTHPKVFRLRKLDAKLEEIMRLLSSTYAVRRNSVIEFIYSGPQEKLKALADAFKIRKDTKPSGR